MTVRPFSEVVSSAAWRAEAERWIRERVADAGATVVGDITQPRVRPWSTQLVVPTDAGPLWFKANCPALAFEPAVHAVLVRLDPGEVDEPLAVEAERGWVLTRDRGTILGDSHDASLDDWQAVVGVAAGMQRRLADRGPELLAAGLPDCAPHTVPARFEELIKSLAALPPEHPSHLDAAAARRLRGAQGLLDDSVATLLGGPLPTASFQHGDLHPGNVFAVAGGLRIFDFGDAQWAHPLETLAVPWGWIDRLSTVPWRPVVNAYASCWHDVIGPDELVQLLPSAMVTQVVNRAFNWWGTVAGATPDELVEWGDSPRYFLELVLDDFTVPEA
ncbi:MAG TPA: phosphotransferase [Lapillicoccus sp.]|jgi:hypothetical protein|nr:phosphotransferase [Lapillicoccus sp.]